MNLRNLRYFVRVAETGSVSAAAELAHRSQPAVSRAIQELEADLGVALFRREGRRMIPTAEALGLLEHARAVLGRAEDFEERARRLASGTLSVLRIGGVATTVESVLPRLIEAFKVAQPAVEIALTVDSGNGLLAALERGELDVIATREVNSELLESRRILPMHVIAVSSRDHPLAARPIIDIGDLIREDLMLGPRTFTSRLLFDAACRGVGLPSRIVLESPYQRALVALAEVGHGIAILPSTVNLAGHAVSARPIRSNGHPIGTWTSLLWDRRRNTTTIKSFVDISVKALKRKYPGAELGLPPLAAKRG